MTTQATVFVVDDDQAARDSLTQLARSHGWPVESYSSPREFLAQFDPQRPGCAVLDLRMDEMSGLELQTRLAQVSSLLPIIIVSGYATVANAVAAMQAGALTVLEKTCSSDEIVQQIRLALERNASDREQAQRRQQARTRLALITPDERQVLDLLLSGETNKKISFLLKLGLRTVESRKARIMAKLEVDSLAELVRLVTWAEDGPPPPLQP